MPQANAASTTVLRFPTTRKAAYRSPVVQVADLPANVVAIHSRRMAQEVPTESNLPGRSPEIALILGVLSALALGNEENQGLFAQVGAQLDKMRGANPDDPSLSVACNLFGKLRGAI